MKGQIVLFVKEGKLRKEWRAKRKQIIDFKRVTDPKKNPRQIWKLGLFYFKENYFSIREF